MWNPDASRTLPGRIGWIGAAGRPEDRITGRSDVSIAPLSFTPFRSLYPLFRHFPAASFSFSSLVFRSVFFFSRVVLRPAPFGTVSRPAPFSLLFPGCSLSGSLLSFSFFSAIPRLTSSLFLCPPPACPVTPSCAETSSRNARQRRAPTPRGPTDGQSKSGPGRARRGSGPGGVPRRTP